MDKPKTPSLPSEMKKVCSRTFGPTESSDYFTPDTSNADSTSNPSATGPNQGLSESGPSQGRPHTSTLLPAFDVAQQPLSLKLSRGYGSMEINDTDSMTTARAVTGMGNVKYVPGQGDRKADVTASTGSGSPLLQMMRDFLVLTRMIPYIPSIFLPLRTKEPMHEFYPSFRNALAKALITLASVSEMILVLVLPLLLVLPIPSLLLLLGGVLFCGVIWLIMYPTQGANIIMSRMELVVPNPTPNGSAGSQVIGLDHFKDERWLFLNGILTEGIDLQKNVDAIARVFGRPVLGIHNKTYGIVADVLECVLQRCFSYPTRDGRIAYEAVKANMLDPEVRKIVLIAHSQGGIVASLVVDRLLTEVPQEIMSKLELYTFGCAADHFNNPVISWFKPPTNFKWSSTESNLLTPLPTKFAIKHIEHYANEFDMVPRWGVLYSVYEIISKHYSGHVFIHMGASGHFFNQHYLFSMFPLDAQAASEFLDQEVSVETDLAHQREAEARRQTTSMRARSTTEVDASTLDGLKSLWLQRWGIEFGDGHTIRMPIGRLGPGEVAFLGGHAEAEAAKGKTVRELSRLWKYTNGGTPDD